MRPYDLKHGLILHFMELVDGRQGLIRIVFHLNQHVSVQRSGLQKAIVNILEL